MAVIREIVRVENKVAASGEKYAITHVVLEDGGEAEGFGVDYKVGDRVEHFFDERYNRIKVRKFPRAESAT